MAKRKRGEADPQSDELDDDLGVDVEDVLDEEEEDDDEERDEYEEEEDDLEVWRALEEEEERAATLAFIFAEELGYSPDYDWDGLPEVERERHEEILSYDREALEKLSAKRLNVLDRWAAAQSYARVGMREAFQESCVSILKSRRRHAALAYEDIYLELISDLAEGKDFEEAFAYLDRFRKAFPDEEEVYQRVRGLLLIESGAIHEGKSILDELMAKSSDNGELHLEIGDDLLAMGHPELALRVLERGKDFARRNRDTELMTALDETRRLALSHIEAFS